MADNEHNPVPIDPRLAHESAINRIVLCGEIVIDHLQKSEQYATWPRSVRLRIDAAADNLCMASAEMMRMSRGKPL